MKIKWWIVAMIMVIIGILIYFNSQKNVGLSPNLDGSMVFGKNFKNNVGLKTNNAKQLTLKDIFKTNNIKQQYLYTNNVFGGELK